MLNFKNDCNCCGIVRKHPKPRWHGCLNFKKPSCPRMNTPSHNVLAPSNAHHSKVMRNVQQLKVATPGGGRWRKVNWKRFKLQQSTDQYQNRVVTNSTNNKYKLVVRNGKIQNQDTVNIDNLNIKSNCRKQTNADLTWEKISQLNEKEVDNLYYGGEGPPIGCKYYTVPSDPPVTTTIDTVNGQYCNKLQQWETR